MTTTTTKRELSLSRLIEKTPLEFFKIVKKQLPSKEDVHARKSSTTTKKSDEGDDPVSSSMTTSERHRPREIVPKTRAELNDPECKITVLSLKGLGIEKINEACFEDARFRTLHRLDLSENSLRELPGTMKLLRLTYLDVSKNPELSCEGLLKGVSPSSCSNLITLNASETRVGEDWSAMLTQLAPVFGPSTRTLILKDCNMKGDFSCAPFTALQSLIISHNPEMRKLELSENGHAELTKISASSNDSLRKMGKLRYAPNLKELRLNACPKLKDLSCFERGGEEEEDTTPSRLATLDVSGCELIQEWKDVTSRLHLDPLALVSLNIRDTPLHRRYHVSSGEEEIESAFEEKAREKLKDFIILSILNSRPFRRGEGRKTESRGDDDDDRRGEKRRRKSVDEVERKEKKARHRDDGTKARKKKEEHDEEVEEGEELGDLVRQSVHGVATVIGEASNATATVSTVNAEKRKAFNVDDFVKGLKSRDDDLFS